MKYQFMVVAISILITGCSIQKLTLRAVDPIIDGSMQSLFEEDDLELARTAIESDLKLLEGLLKSHPENEKLLFFATQGYAAYALGFVEDHDSERAQKLYIRAKNFGLKILSHKKQFKAALHADVDAFSKSLSEFSKKDVPALFWTANAWSSYINLNLTDPQALIELPKVQAIMQRVLELDESYFFGGAHLFFATILAAKPPLLGGNPEKAKQHFDKCLEFSDGKFLLPYVYYAKYYAVRTLNQDLFQQLLQKVLSTSIDVLPEQRLPNAIAKKKARRLLDAEAELF